MILEFGMHLRGPGYLLKAKEMEFFTLYDYVFNCHSFHLWVIRKILSVLTYFLFCVAQSYQSYTG
jgi:hypothetical protein